MDEGEGYAKIMVGMHMVEIVCPKHGKKLVFQVEFEGRVITGRCQDCMAEDPLGARPEEVKYWNEKAEENREQQNERIRQQIISNSDLPSENLNNTFQNFIMQNDDHQKIYAYLFELLDGHHKSVLLYGTTGVGKTHLAAATINEAARRGIGCKYTKESTILNEIKAAFSTNFVEAVIQKYSRYPLLVIDEIDKAPESEFNTGIMFDIYDNRVSNNRKTILVGNLTGKEFKAHYSEPIRSRISEGGSSFGMKGEDWRLK